MNAQEKHLSYLSELSDYKVDDNYADVTGWEVKDAALRRVGKVKNLLVDIKTERVVYLDVEVDSSIIDAAHDPYAADDNSGMREFINDKGENHIIIPIGLVDINMANEYVFAENIDHTTFASTKRIRPNTPIARNYENAVLDSYRRRHDQNPIDERADSNVENKDSDIEDSEDYRDERMDDIKKRRGIAEYRKDKTSSTNDETDWYDAENERMEDDELSEEDYFYGKKEFDDSRFYQGKK